MLSLVQYSDESDNDDFDDDENIGAKAVIVQKPAPALISGEIEDDEYEAPPQLSKKLSLPAPKTASIDDQEEIHEQNHTNEKNEQRLSSNEAVFEDNSSVTENLIHSQLPRPTKQFVLDVEEEEDEFLKKKAIPTVEPPPPPSTIKPKGPVKITIPSLKDFKDVDDDLPGTSRGATSAKNSSLLNMLPKPRAEALMQAKNTTPSPSSSTTSTTQRPPPVRKVTSLVPDSVKRKAELAAKAVREKILKTSKNEANKSDDSDNSDVESSDFFSFDRKDDKLPEVSTSEIEEMVAKRAAKIAETKSKVEEAMTAAQEEEITDEIYNQQRETMLPPDMSAEELFKLQGGNRAKRAKVEEISFVEISDVDLKPSRDEFLRTQLAQQTQFVPTGNLVGYDSTSKRKSQITFLAQKALANEQELQALWAANRQKQRASSSKYGF